MKPENNPIKRAIRKPTYLNAIKAMCAHCMGCTLDHLEEGFREEIRNCIATRCPLFPFRPYKGETRGAKVQESNVKAKPCQPIGSTSKRSKKMLEVGFQGVLHG